LTGRAGTYSERTSQLSKTIKLALVIMLVLLMAGSGVLFIVALTHPSNAYDPGKIKLKVELHTRTEILTCAYKVYGDQNQNQWAAKTIIKNIGKMPVYDFKIWYKVGDFTDWTSGEDYPVISPGETVRDYCWPALDGEKVKAITTKTPVELVMKYEYKGLKEPIEDYKTIYMLGRNDFVFSSMKEEDRLTFADNFDNELFLAAFITPNESTTKAFANGIASGLETRTSDSDAYQAFLRCFDTLRAQGVKYIQEPSGFWTGSEAQYVQYPKDTIERKSGTCIDLAICISALMEAVGIKSYVALVPGHAIPLIQLPGSGDIIPIESTFIDQEYALSHYPGETSQNVTAEECVKVAKSEIDQYSKEGKLVLVDPEYWWQAGVMPSW
jgi:hypothetical protein